MGLGKNDLIEIIRDMKKIFFIFTVTLVFISFDLAHENVAINRIESYLYSYYGKTNKIIELQLDSAFAPYDDPKLYKIVEKHRAISSHIDDLVLIMKQAKSSMSLWSRHKNTKYGRKEFQEALNEYNMAERYLNNAKEECQKLSNEIKEMLETTKYIGIKAAIVFSYTNREGVTTISNSVLLLDSNLKTLDYICNQEEFNQIKETITKIQENQ